MTQAARIEVPARAFAVPGNSTDRADIAIATGEEIPVTSPALELQKALDEMLTTAHHEPTDVGRLVVFGTALVSAGAVCMAFWWTVLQWTASILG